jgi:hypothetical protein
MRPRHKFGAVRTDVNGRTYSSKLEASYAARLHAERAAGLILGWLEQVPLHLPGKTKYVLDFLVFTADGEVRAVECKGMETAVYKVKRRLVEEAFPWMPIEVVKAEKSAKRMKRGRKAA